MQRDAPSQPRSKSKLADTAMATFDVSPRRVGLVAIDKTRANPNNTSRTSYAIGFDPFLSAVADAAEREGCDALVYALWSHDVCTMGPLTQDRLFGRTTKVHVVFLEVGDAEGAFHVQVWRRGISRPHQFTQRFNKSSSSASKKRAFMEELGARTFGTTLFLTCGESNIVSTVRQSDRIVDPFGFLSKLAAIAPTLILNPTHDYMRRPEMKVKRALYSRGRMLLCVWNRGNKPPEAAAPWQAFVDGQEVTTRIREVPFAPTNEIRLGVVDVVPPNRS